MFRKSIIICTLAIVGSLSVAKSEEPFPREHGAIHTLYCLYAFSPENPWHDYLVERGEMPLALYTVKQHLTVADPSLQAHFEEQQLMGTIFLCFAAYLSTHKDTAWDRIHSHLETAFDSAEGFFNENGKEDTIKDIILALEENILVPYQAAVPELWEVVLAQIPWFLEGVPPYISDFLNREDTGLKEEEVLIDETECTGTHALESVPQIATPLSNAETPKTKTKRDKKSLQKIWEEDIKPFLDSTRTKFKNVVKKVKESDEFQKAKASFDKAEREVRSLRKEATQKVKKILKF